MGADSTYTLCTDASGVGTDEIIAQADQLVRDDKMDAASELYHFRLKETPTDACAARGLAYIAAGPSPDRAGVAAAASGWDDFFEAWLRPGYRLVVPFLIVLAVLLAVTRLVTGIAVNPDRRSWDQHSETGVTRRRRVYGAGVAALVMTAAWSAIFNSWLPMTPWLRIVSWIIAAVAAFVGVWATALGRGLALRIRIEGRAADGPTSALGSHVLARLQLLGSQRPRDLSVPVQTDVTTLPDDAISVLPQSDLAKAAFRLFQTLGSAVPWRVTVTAVSEGITAVEISRNGRLVDSTVMTYTLSATEAASAPADVKEIAGAVGAAAFILVTLAERHPTLRIGLCGATRPVGLSAQVLATGVFRGSAGLQRKMLAGAVENDPGNLAARVALLHVDGRRATDPDAARVYAEGLDGVLDTVTKNRQAEPHPEPKRGWDALLLRGLFNASVAWMNHYLFETAAAASRPSEHGSLVKARMRVERLSEILAEDYRRLPLRELAADMRPASDFLRAAIYAAAGVAPVDYTPPSDTEGDHSLTAIYTRACWKAIRAERDETYLTRALDDLATAASMPSFAEWARHDPSFQVFRRPETKTEVRRRYRTIVGLVMPSDFLALPAFAAHADALWNIGVRSADALLHEDPRELAETLGVTLAQSRRWQAVASLSRVTSSPDGPPLTVEMLFLLMASGVDSVEALRDALSPKRKTALHARLATVAQEHAVAPPTVESIAQWILPAQPRLRLIDRLTTLGFRGRDSSRRTSVTVRGM